MPSAKPGRLSAAEVRKCAASFGGAGCRELQSPVEESSVLSFLIGQPGDKASLARINVYTESGTIGTCRVMNGQVREVFRRNVTSIETLKTMLQEPADLAFIDDSFVGANHDVHGSLSQSLPDRMELADLGLAILVGERQRLEQHLQAIHSYDSDGTTTTSDQNEDSSAMEFEFGFPEDVVEQVDQCLGDIGKLGKHVTCVGINKGAVLLYGHGGVAYTPDIPKALYQKLKLLKRPDRKDIRPSYVALGSRDRYFVSYHDGTADWKGPKAFDKIMKNRSPTEPPRSVAFGSTYDTYFIVHHDGSWEWHGKGIPDALVEKLQDRGERPDLTCCTLGPKGEWYLRAKNGRMWWGGIGEELDVVLEELLGGKPSVNFMDFGEDDSYFVGYET